MERLKTPEEMGVRKSYGCGDLIPCLRMVSEKSVEWGETVWAASLDLEKAFDKVIHSAVSAGVSDCDLRAVQNLYARQCAFVQ